MVRSLGLVPLVVLVAALAGCSFPQEEGSTVAPPATGASSSPAVVRAVDDAFEPPRLSVAVGAVVAWTNAGQSPHGVALPALGLDVILEPGASTNASFPAPGTYAYRCKLHRGMAGNVTVGGVDAPVAPPAGNASGGDVPAAPPPPPGAVVRDVTVVDDAFQPAGVTVPVGGSVRWTNRGGTHSVTFSALPIDRVLDEGQQFSAGFGAPGTFAYVCRFHDEMRGTVSVVPAGAEDAAPPPPASDASAVIVLDAGHYDERPVDVAAGTPVTWRNPAEEGATVEFRDRADVLVVPAGGEASLVLPAGEHWWRDAREEGEWRAADHDVGVIRVA